MAGLESLGRLILHRKNSAWVEEQLADHRHQASSTAPATQPSLICYSETFNLQELELFVTREHKCLLEVHIVLHKLVC